MHLLWAWHLLRQAPYQIVTQDPDISIYMLQGSLLWALKWLALGVIHITSAHKPLAKSSHMVPPVSGKSGSICIRCIKHMKLSQK